MTLSPFSSPLYGPLLSDPDLAALFDDRAALRLLLEVEAALAEAEGRLKIIPADAAARIAAAARALDLDPAALAAQTAVDGLPIPALVKALRGAVGSADGTHVHYGATSQDIIDTALVLALRDGLAILEQRLVRLARTLGKLAAKHRRTVMPARTRTQPAVPTTFGAKVAGWIAPLLRHLDRLAEMRPRLLVVSFAGAAGTRSALAGKGGRVEAEIARRLRLGVPSAPWHAARDGLAEFGSFLSLVTGSLGKIGQDVVLHGQAEVGELRVGGRGGSSTMPHKANPVAAELLVTLARYNAGRVGSLHDALIHAHERDGAAWTLEWLVLPEMAVAAGAATRIAGDLVAGLTVDARAMRAHLVDAPGLLFSEAAAFALAKFMPKPEAEALVKQAVPEAIAAGRRLLDVLADKTAAPVDWASLADPERATGDTDAIIDQVLDRIP
jgi:3-carboxy-cis,cis-muconate cycloisomerase